MIDDWNSQGEKRRMSKKLDKSLIVGLDIGTSKICSIVSEIGVDGEIEIIGVGFQRSRGLKNGVVNLRLLKNSISFLNG